MIVYWSLARAFSRPPDVARTVAVALALACLAVVPACSGSSFWPFGGDGETEAPPPAAAARPDAVLQAVAVRIRQEDEKTALRIAAVANDALMRHGIRPEATAPQVLFLRFDRPRTLESSSGPKVGIVGRGGSSSETDLGVAIQIPLGGKPPPPPPARHEVVAELESGAGNIIWRRHAVKDAVPAAGINTAVLRDLIERIISALARETGVERGEIGR